MFKAIQMNQPIKVSSYGNAYLSAYSVNAAQNEAQEN